MFRTIIVLVFLALIATVANAAISCDSDDTKGADGGTFKTRHFATGCDTCSRS